MKGKEKYKATNLGPFRLKRKRQMPNRAMEEAQTILAGKVISSWTTCAGVLARNQDVLPTLTSFMETTRSFTRSDEMELSCHFN